MAKITYMPWNEIVVHEVLEYEPKVFLENTISGVLAQGGAGNVPTISWAKGIAFAVAGFPDTQDVVREKLKGVVHYNVVSFARMPYRSEVNVEVRGNTYQVRLRNTEVNPIFRDLANFLLGQASS